MPQFVIAGGKSKSDRKVSRGQHFIMLELSRVLYLKPQPPNPHPEQEKWNMTVDVEVYAQPSIIHS